MFHGRQILELWRGLGTTLTLLVISEFQVGKEFLVGGDFLRIKQLIFFFKIH